MTKDEKKRLTEKLNNEVFDFKECNSLYEGMKQCIDEFDGDSGTTKLTKEDILEIATYLISNAQESVAKGADQVEMVYLLAYNDAVLDFKDELLKKINKEVDK